MLLAAALLSLAACTREADLESGNDVRFTVTAVRAGAPDTRTVYNDGLLPDGAVSLCWQAGDRVSIWSPEAGVYNAGSYPHNAASYTINGQDPDCAYGKATGISRVSSGLEWGTSDTHTFYGRYPDPTGPRLPGAPYYGYNRYEKQDLKSTSFLCWLPQTISVTPTTGVYSYSQNMMYCFMTAYATVPRNSTVHLDFVPAVSTFRINIPVSDGLPELAISAVALKSDSHRLNGDFSVNMAADRTFNVDDDCYWNNTIVTMEFESPVTVPSGQVLSVTFFTCPVTANDLTLTVTCADGSTMTLPLKTAAGEAITFQAATFYDINCGEVGPSGSGSGSGSGSSGFSPQMFSVGNGKRVFFSPGNLQLVGEDTWQFAGQQWECFGTDQSDNHRDLFGWGTGDDPNLVSTGSDYASFSDWGSNTISNGGDYAWRTLTADEWQYLFARRDRDGHKLFTAATVLDVPGIILFPDDFCPGMSFTDGAEHFADNTITDATEWSALESFGCVFLPAAGYRNGTGISGVDQRGIYWSSTANGSNNAYNLDFNDGGASPNADDYRYCGFSVRLVRDQHQFSVAEGKVVVIAPGNLQYNKNTYTWSFMEHQYDMAEENDRYVGWDYSSEDVVSLFGWGTSGFDLSPYTTLHVDEDYVQQYGPGITSGEFAAVYDWGRYNTISNGGDYTWRTPTTTEWQYLLQSRSSTPRYAQATVAGVYGLIIFPDNYVHPSGVTAINNADSACTGYADNTYDAATWSALERVGCIFLPASGRRDEHATELVGDEGYYWTSTAHGSESAYTLYFYDGTVSPGNTNDRYYGHSVRLFRDFD